MLLDDEPAVVILDLRLLGVDGVEVMRRIDTSGMSVPVIIRTAVTDQKIVQELDDFGTVDYRLKPYSGEALGKIRGESLALQGGDEGDQQYSPSDDGTHGVPMPSFKSNEGTKTW